MARITLGANMRSNTPPIPPAPSQLVEIRTSDAAPCGETVNVVTLLEFVSDSVRTRPGSGLGDLRPELAGAPARRHLVMQDRARAHATRLDPEVRKRRRQEPRMVLTHVCDVAVDRLGGRIHRALSGDHDPCHAGLSITTGKTHSVPNGAVGVRPRSARRGVAG